MYCSFVHFPRVEDRLTNNLDATVHNLSVKTGAITGMTRSAANLVYTQQNRIIVTIDINGFDNLDISIRDPLLSNFYFGIHNTNKAESSENSDQS